MDVGTGVRASKTPERTLNGHTHIGADPGDTEQRLENKRGAGREPHDQHGVLAMLNTTRRRHVAKKGKENTGRLKKEVTINIKVRAWRNKRNRNKRWRKDKDQMQIQEINITKIKMEIQSLVLTTQESLRYRAETELEPCYAA